MKFSPSHSLALALALALVGGGASVALGGDPALTTRATRAQNQTQPVVAAVVSSPTETTTPTRAPVTGTPGVTRTHRPVSWAQAATLAASQTHASVEDVEATAGPYGTDYQVKLSRPDGSEIEVTVHGRTGHVVATSQHVSLDETPDVVKGGEPGN